MHKIWGKKTNEITHKAEKLMIQLMWVPEGRNSKNGIEEIIKEIWENFSDLKWHRPFHKIMKLHKGYWIKLCRKTY